MLRCWWDVREGGEHLGIKRKEPSAVSLQLHCAEPGKKKKEGCRNLSPTELVADIRLHAKSSVLSVAGQQMLLLKITVRRVMGDS